MREEKRLQRRQSDESGLGNQERKRQRAVRAPEDRRRPEVLVRWRGVIVQRCEVLKHAQQARIDEVAGRYPLLRRLLDDSFFRMISFTYPTFAIDILYAIVYGIMGIAMLSPWCGTIAAFYILLSLMRFFVLREERIARRDVPEAGRGQRSWRTYRAIGVMLILTTFVFSGMIVLLVKKLAAIEYPGYFVYAAAVYTTYQVVYATMQFVRTHRRGEPIAAALRSIGVANMLLSLLSLQTALITAFGDPADIFAVRMSGITGGVVCLLIVGIGISMVVGARRELMRADWKSRAAYLPRHRR